MTLRLQGLHSENTTFRLHELTKTVSGQTMPVLVELEISGDYSSLCTAMNNGVWPRGWGAGSGMDNEEF